MCKWNIINIHNVQPRVYAVVADMGTDIPMGWAVTHQLENDNKLLNFSLILHAGDVAYAGTGSEWEFEVLLPFHSLL
jgi:hypothetical protein